MAHSPRPQKVTPFRLTPAIAEKRIRLIAIDGGNIAWAIHAQERMEERGINDLDVLRTLRGGSIVGAPEPTPRGEWKCKMVYPIRGAREVGVVTLILQSNRLFVKTVEWEDVR